MNADIEEFRKFLDEMYPNAVMAHFARKILAIADGLEKRVRDLEKRWEEGEG